MPDELGHFLREMRMRVDPNAARMGSYERLASRHGRRVTQEEAAEALGVSRVWYGLLEGGNVHVSVRLLAPIAETFMLTGTERLELIRLAAPLSAPYDAISYLYDVISIKLPSG